MTFFRLLTEGIRHLESCGDKDAALDARELLLAAFHMDLAHYLLNRMQEYEGDEFHQKAEGLYREMIVRRGRRVPLQQILGRAWFMGLEFYVNRHVLIPRQDTETLVELVLKDCEKRQAAKAHWRPSLLDICTGSGCIAVSLAAIGEFSQVAGTDISEEALGVARLNAERLLDGQGILFFRGDLFGALPHDGMLYDIVTSNPPYIPTGVIASLEPEVREHEPRLALDGSQDGLYYYKRIAAEADAYLAPGGGIYLEIGHDQGEAVCALMHGNGYEDVRVFCDLAGHDRVVRARKSTSP